MQSDDVIMIRGLTKVFYPIELRLRSLRPLRRHPPVLALRDLSLAVRRGETLGLLGTNGAGKTTLLKILATLILPNAGKATVHGWDVVQDAGQVRRTVGVVTGAERSFYWPPSRGSVRGRRPLASRSFAGGSGWTLWTGALACTQRGCASGWPSPEHSYRNRLFS